MSDLEYSCFSCLFLLTLGLILEETIDLGNGSVEGNDGETVISSIENQVLAHNGQTDKTKVTTRFRLRKASSNAGKSRSKLA